MALKKEFLDNFFNQKLPLNNESTHSAKSKYKKHRVFDDMLDTEETNIEITQKKANSDIPITSSISAKINTKSTGDLIPNQKISNQLALLNQSSINNADLGKIRLDSSLYVNSIGDKLETNRRQTGDEIGDKLETNRRQIEDNHGTSRQYVIPSNLNWRQTRDEIGDITEDKQETNRRQTDDKLATKNPKLEESVSFSSLIGIQKKITLFIFDNCKVNGSNQTPQITIEHISEFCNIPYLSIKKTIQRLVEKNIIIRINSKTGRGGWTIYSLTKHIFQEVISAELHKDYRKDWRQIGDKSETNKRQIVDKLETKSETQLETSVLSSSSYINNTTTTNDLFKLNEDWLLIDISPLAEIGFSDAQLKQIAKAGKLTPEQVQESIYAFAYARTKPEIANNIRTNHLGYFMGILIKRSEPYLPPTGYESPKEIALKAELERKKRQLALEEELAEIKFIEWYSSLNTEVKEELTREQASDEDYKLYFEPKQIPEHVKESKRKSILRPYFINLICKKT